MDEKIVAMICMTAICLVAMWLMPAKADVIVCSAVSAMAGFITGFKIGGKDDGSKTFNGASVGAAWVDNGPVQKDAGTKGEGSK